MNKVLADIFNELKHRQKVKTKEDFATKMGYNRSYVSVLFNSEGITDKVKAALVRVYDINPTFVESGKGEMFGTKTSLPKKGKRITTPPIVAVEPKQIPVYNVQGMAGADKEADMTPITNPDTYMSAEDLDIASMCDAVIYVWGNSMLPNMSPGTKLGLEANYDNFFNWGEVMLIETRSNRLIKRVFPSDKGENWISCHSDNTMTFETGSRKGQLAYPPIDIPISDIIRKFDVVASQKMHKTSKVRMLRQFRESA